MRLDTRPRKKCSANIYTKIDSLEVEIVPYFDDNHDLDKESRHKAKIMVITAIPNS